jgi:ribosomal protein L35
MNSIINKEKFVLVPNISYKFGLLVAGHKTSSTASKRFIRTPSGNLKYGHAGKKHLNRGKGRKRLRRLGKMSVLEGVWLKKMLKIL